MQNTNKNWFIITSGSAPVYKEPNFNSPCLTEAVFGESCKILDENNLKLADIQKVIGGIAPLPGAKEFLSWLESEFQVIILSDTFNQFAGPLMAQLDYPTLFCHDLIVDETGRIADYRLRIPDAKTKAVAALKLLNLKVIAAGDSYNDTGMLKEADAGILFRAPDNVVEEFPQFPVTRTYDEFKTAIIEVSKKLEGLNDII